MLPVVREIPYQNASYYLGKLSRQSNVALLDSAKLDERFGRYSFLAFDPFTTVESKNGKVVISNGYSPRSKGTFDILQEMLEQYQSATVENLPPFQGGLIGYFAYELLHELETVPKPPLDLINIPDLFVGLYDVIIALDHEDNKAMIISQGFPELDSEKRFQRAKARADHVMRLLNQSPSYQYRQSWSIGNENQLASNFTKSAYCKAVEKTIDYIYAGDIFQANISQCFSCKLPDSITVYDLYSDLAKKNPAPFSALLDFGRTKIVSASPERFLFLKGTKVETRPIKGTRKRSTNPIEDRQLALELSNSEKDHAENTMIVDLMRNDLSRVCHPDTVSVSQLCGLETYATVHHLVSVVDGELMPDKDATDLLKATFPGGSITGAPKVRAMEIISELEQRTRGAYCGSIGYIGFDGTMDTSIVIRTYTISGDNVYFQAGGGIVADSVPQDEYSESLTKAKALCEVIKGESVIYDTADR